MRIIEKPKISGVEWLLIECDRCEQQFLVAPDEINNHGNVKCEFCPNISRRENIDGVIASDESRRQIVEPNSDTGERMKEV